VWLSEPRIPIHPQSGIAMTIQVVGKNPAGEAENTPAKIN
jgi:hypothetical protein